MKVASKHPSPLPCYYQRFRKTILSFMKQLICLTLIFGVKASVLGQPVCGFDQNHLQFQQTFPDAARLIKENEKKIRHFSKSGMDRQIFNIPVVVHILHTGDTIGSPYNPPDEKIYEAINYLNEIYSGQHHSLTPAGADAAGDIGIRFEFAKRDPECNPTTGIRRVNMSANAAYLENGALNADVGYDTQLKTPIAWDISRYYNIYVVNKINGNSGSAGQYVAGFAYFPVNHIIDGTVILASEMKRGSKTLIHEIGHAFNLYHPFEGSGHRDQCPSGEGDFVNDTDPISMNADDDGFIDFTCRTDINTCTNHPYSIRTEHNIMNYTGCYTLFTPGQKERMLASLAQEPRASLVSSDALLSTFEGNGASCDPKINFEEEEVMVLLPPVQKTGCREYKDFTFYFTISNTPSKNATVTLSQDVSSEGTEKIDFDFVGSKQVVFPAGSRQKKPFTIRVYNTGQRDVPGKLALNFTVNGGQGNTVKGTAVPVMNIRLRPNDTRPVIHQSTTYPTIGRATRVIEDAFLFDATLRYQKSLIQYNRDEMLHAGLRPGAITGMQLFLVKNSTRSFRNLRIKAAHTASPALVTDGDITPAEARQEVFFASSYSTGDGANIFTFDQPFVWNGRDNIRIEICFDNQSTSGTGGSDHIEAFADAGFEVSNFLTSLHTCNASFTNFSNYGEGIKPVIVFSQIATGNPVADSKAVSQQSYLGPYGHIYFYDDATPKRIIASIKNLTDWNYGCTRVEIDRVGVRAFPFWNINPGQFITEKTFLVTPQFSTPDANYEVSLYYTAAEKEGYEEATDSRWSHIQLFKTNGIPVGTINPLNRQQNNVALTGDVQHSDFGGDYVLTGTFTGMSERSGFSAGMIDSALPLDWLQFNAVVKDTYVLLEWTTGNEINTSYFDIEGSRDGITFSVLGQLAANNRSTNSYQYRHDDPGSGTWFYRLKQVDDDRKYTYSQVIRVRLPGGGEELPPVIYPVPAGNSITIDFGKTISNASIRILTTDLKPVQIERIAGAVQRKNIPVGQLPAGTYLVQVVSPGDHYVLRFIKY